MIISPQYALIIGHNERCMEEFVNTKSLGIQIDNHMQWRNNINELISELRGACCAVTSCFISPKVAFSK
jgi:hypothetical protein